MPRLPSPYPPGHRRDFLYKQTQFALERSGMQVLYRQRVMVNRLCRGLRQYKANSGRCPAGRGDWGREPGLDPSSRARAVYKQTQFGAVADCATSPQCPASGNDANLLDRGLGDVGRGRVQTKPISREPDPRRSQTCETNPISPAGTGRTGPEGRRAWGVVQTKPIPRHGLSCETKPVLGWRAGTSCKSHLEIRYIAPVVWHKQ